MAYVEGDWRWRWYRARGEGSGVFQEVEVGGLVTRGGRGRTSPGPEGPKGQGDRRRRGWLVRVVGGGGGPEGGGPGRAEGGGRGLGVLLGVRGGSGRVWV